MPDFETENFLKQNTTHFTVQVDHDEPPPPLKLKRLNVNTGVESACLA